MRVSGLLGLLSLMAVLFVTAGCDGPLRDLNEQYRNRVAGLQSDKERLLTELDKTRTSLLSAQTSVKDLEKQLGDLKEEHRRLQTKYDSAIAELSETRKQLDALRAKYDEAKVNISEVRNYLKELQDQLSDKMGGVDIVGDRVRVTIESDFLFDLGKWDVKPASVPALTRIVGVINGPEWTGKIESIIIQGHTDDTPIKDPARYHATTKENANFVLGFLRGFNVGLEMVKAGISWNNIEISSVAFYRPIAPNDAKDNKAKNRRVEIYIKPKADMGETAIPAKAADVDAEKPLEKKTGGAEKKSAEPKTSTKSAAKPADLPTE